MVKYFLERRAGILINMSGRGGGGDPAPYTAVYACTKAAVTSFTKSLAEENRSAPISIHAVMPGMVATDFYKEENMQTSPRLKATANSLPYIMKAVGVPADEVGKLFARVAGQEPGKSTGKVYTPLTGLRKLRAVGILMYYRTNGKIKA